MKPVAGEDVARWVARKLNLCPMGGLTAGFVRPYTAIGFLDASGEICGAYVLNGYSGNDVEITIAGAGAVSRGAFRFVADYVFGELGCTRISATVRRSNARALRLAERLGFEREGIKRRYYGNEDAILLGLLKERFLNGKFSKNAEAS